MFTSIKHYLERGLKNDVIPLAVLTDMILSTTQIHFEGDRQSGWLARLSISLDSDSTITFYLIQTKEGIRLRSCSDMHAENGYLAHTYLVRGQLQSAERLLDWMAKNVNSASDPFKGTPFSHIWTSSVRRDIRTMQLAAAALIAEERPRARLAVRLLRKLKRKIRLPHHRLQLTRALANAYNKLDHHKKALKLYRKLHAMAPRAENPFYNLGLCLTELRQYKKVERLARKRFKNHPHDPWAYLLLMQRCLHKKQPKEIIELADKWIANAASSKHSNALRPWAHIMRAIAYVQMGKKHYKKALVDAVKANELSEASNRLILMKTALILVQLGKLRRAFALFMKLLEKRSIELPSSDEHYLRAKIAWAAGLKETAIRSLKRIKPHDLGEKTLYYKDAEKMLKRITKRPQSENPS
jgi:tetratricopeptide (TPR) repeat protein